MAARNSPEHMRSAVGLVGRTLPFGVAALVLYAQFLVLIIRSQHQNRSFNVGIDFALFLQAYHQIAHGNLSP
jgi:hypothetical protein